MITLRPAKRDSSFVLEFSVVTFVLKFSCYSLARRLSARDEIRPGATRFATRDHGYRSVSTREHGKQSRRFRNLRKNSGEIRLNLEQIANIMKQ